ncbi:hypothetical protein DSM02_234 [Leeuwenhoekiella polynyae]|uniref:Uncharacterized protein n=1 Tax=Leeuwenhoekiella polynyae TaxID=1550906 RepID=A0A4Q0PHU5_9FLAO|nr:hypothetical protein DSM02_234 [Leeuwenhoekiella polynyae]
MNSIVNYPALNGIIQIVASLYWAWHFVHLWYLYQYTDMLINFEVPKLVTRAICNTEFTRCLGWVIRFIEEIKKRYAQLIGLLFFGLLIDLILMF